MKFTSNTLVKFWSNSSEYNVINQNTCVANVTSLQDVEIPRHCVALICDGTNITDLIGCPLYIKYLSCVGCPMLLSLEGIPAKLQLLNISMTPINSVINDSITLLSCDKSGVELIDCCQLNTLACTESPIRTITANKLHNLRIDKCQISSLNIIPRTVKHLSCVNCNISSLNNIPPFMERLDISSNNITSLEFIPLIIKELNCSHNKLTIVSPLIYSKLTHFDCSHNAIEFLYGCPDTVVHLNCSHNKLTSLIGCTDLTNVKTLTASNNNMHTLYGCPKNIAELDVSHNKLRSLKFIPSTRLTALDISHNNISCLDSLPQTIRKLNILNVNLDSTIQPQHNISNVVSSAVSAIVSDAIDTLATRLETIITATVIKPRIIQLITKQSS